MSVQGQITDKWTISNISAVGGIANISRLAVANARHVITDIYVMFSNGTSAILTMTVNNGGSSIMTASTHSIWSQFIFNNLYLICDENANATVFLSDGLVGGIESLVVCGYTIK